MSDGTASDVVFSLPASVSYEYVAPGLHQYAGPNDVNLGTKCAPAELPAGVQDSIVATPAPAQSVSTGVLSPGGEVRVFGDAGNRNEVVFSVDADGRLQHNLGGRFGFASPIDLDPAADGVQSRRIGEIGRLTYLDRDAAGR